VASSAVLSAYGSHARFGGAAARDAVPAKLSINSLSVTDFRNYDRLRMVCDGRPVVLSGSNGAGKTNLLEALSFLAPGRGLRRARLSEVTRHGADGGAWAVAVSLSADQGELAKLGTGLLPGENGVPGERRVVRIDGAPQSSTACLTQWLSVVWLTPEMDRLFNDAASDRRRFLDRLAYGLDAGHATRLNAYDRSLRERSRLLRDGAMPNGTPPDPVWLDATEAAMAEHGVAVAAARRETLARLVGALQQAGDTVFPRAEMALDGVLEDWLAELAAVDVEDRFRVLLARQRGRDAQAGRALDGPHRTDLRVRHCDSGMPAADCSTGQQKSLLIAIILAYARVLRSVAAPPILLLDEVAAHLDGHARARLFDAIDELGAQAWLTGTDRAVFDAMGDRAQYFNVANGRVCETPA